MQTHLRCLRKACEKFAISHQAIDRHGNFLKLVINGYDWYFMGFRTPFNTQVMAGLCQDKEHAYQLLSDRIEMPKTLGFLDYDVKEKYHKYLKFKSLEAIIEEIQAQFDWPVVVKPNRGSLGRNVLLCRDTTAVKQGLAAVFNKASSEYDYVALAQTYIQPQREFRLVCFRGEPVLAYERFSGNTVFNARYWEIEQGRTILIDDADLLKSLRDFAQPALALPGLEYTGLDILQDTTGAFWLLELNSMPMFTHVIENHGTTPVEKMYEKMLSRLLESPAQ